MARSGDKDRRYRPHRNALKDGTNGQWLITHRHKGADKPPSAASASAPPGTWWQ